MKIMHYLRTISLLLGMACMVFSCVSRDTACSEAGFEALSEYIKRESIALNGQMFSLVKDSGEELSSRFQTALIPIASLDKNEMTIAVTSRKLGNNTEHYRLTLRKDRDSLAFSVLADGVGQRTVRIKFVDVPAVDCDVINAANALHLIQLQAEANQCCCPRRTCVPMCRNGQIVGYAMYGLYPNNGCGLVLEPQELQLADQVLLNRQLNAAVAQGLSLLR
jgi:hypothetical protein